MSHSVCICVCMQDALHFVCSLACSEEFQKVNNMVGVCEYCKNIGIISDAKRVDKKDCCFCSEGEILGPLSITQLTAVLRGRAQSLTE